MIDVLDDMAVLESDLSDDLFEHRCPYHDDLAVPEGLEPSAYEAKWLDLCCSEIAMCEESVRRAAVLLADEEMCVNDTIFHRRQIHAAGKVADGIRARMSRVLHHEPELEGPDLVDLWRR